MGRLDGKIALIFGAGSIGPGWGNGRAAAVAFAREGATVVATDIDEAALRDTSNLVKKEGLACDTQIGDVSDSSSVRDIVEGAVARHGRIDILHNNVGISAMGGPTDIDEATWDRVISINLKGMFLTCRQCLPIMETNGGGVIINVGSVSGIRYLGLPQIAYATSKGAIATMTRAIAAQYGPKNIRANVIVAGIVDTPLLAVGAARTFRDTFGAANADAARKMREATIPLRHFGDAWDVANTAVFLASDEARYITGAEIVVDGGLTAQIQYPASP
jgi:NAD(P)-dependent dehydrogenase (short-subunit alcohol dehydrogenase family)